MINNLQQLMADLGSRLKQTIHDQSTNLKFMELLNSNRQIQSIKDRQVIPSIPLSSFNQTGLPPIYKEKIGLKARSNSDVKLKNKQINKAQKQKQLLNGIPESIQSSIKNISKQRNKSLQSSHRSRRSKQSIRRETEVINKDEKPQLLLQGLSSHKNSQYQLTPKKLKIQLQPQTITTKNGTTNKKLIINKTIQQISNEAMDSLMLNLKFGKIQENVSYKTFLKKEGSPPPQQCIKKLQEWINKFKLKSGIIYTKNLQQVFNKKYVSNNEVLLQFANYSQLRKQYQDSIPGLKYYPENDGQDKGKHLAATKIQSLLRMNFDIIYTKKLKSLMSKVKTIQRYWRVSLEYKKGRQSIMNRVLMKIQKVKALTNGLIKNWDIIKTSPRVQIHICSLSFQQFKRLSIQDIHQRESSQLTRIFRALQADCTVIYVSPILFPSEIIRYYEKIFSFGNKVQAFRDRLYFLSVQTIIARIPVNIPTASALLYDSFTLQKIRQIIKNRQSPVMNQVCAYIVPSYPSNQYTNLAAELDVPIFSGPQSLCKLYSTKSGSYELIKQFLQGLGEKSPFVIPKSAHGIYSQKQLIRTLAVLIYKNRDTKKWILKIDDEVNSRGIAILNVDSLAFLKQLRKQNQDCEEIQIEQKQMIKLIAEQLKLKLRIRLKIINKLVYPNYDSYLSHFLTRGGFIQSCVQAEQKQGKVSKPIQHSISFKIDPNGQFQILGTYSRLVLGFKTTSSSIECPSEVKIEEVDNEKIVRSLYRLLWTKLKLFGYFTIDFLYVEDKANKMNKLTNKSIYFIGFDCFLNQKTSSINVVLLTSSCEYSKQQNRIYLKKKLEAQNKDKSQWLSQRSKSQKAITQSSVALQDTEVSKGSSKNIQDRKPIHFIYCPFLKIQGLPSIQDFFKMCKFNNVSFDIQSKTGTLFLLQGGLQNGCFGFICVGNAKEKMTEQAIKLIEFLSKDFRQKYKKNEIGKNWKGDEIGQLRGYLLNNDRKQKARKLKKEQVNLSLIF